MSTNHIPHWPTDPLLSKEWRKRTYSHNLDRVHRESWPAHWQIRELAPEVEKAVDDLLGWDLFSVAGYLLNDPNLSDVAGNVLDEAARDEIFDWVRAGKWSARQTVTETPKSRNPLSTKGGTTTADISGEQTVTQDISAEEESTEVRSEREFRAFVAQNGRLPSNREIRKLAGGRSAAVDAVCNRLRSSEEFAPVRLTALLKEALTKSLYNCREVEKGEGEGITVLDHAFDVLRSSLDFATRELFRIALAANHPVCLLTVTPQDGVEPSLRLARRGYEDDAYIALCAYSRLFATELIAGIGRHVDLEDQFPYAYVNEIQDEASRLFHWQAFAILPPSSLSEESLEDIARDALGAVYEAAIIKLTPSLPSSFIEDFTVHITRGWKFDPTYEFTYLAKKRQKDPRSLRRLGGKRLSPFHWAGWSNGLNQQTTTTTTTTTTKPSSKGRNNYGH